MANQTCRPCPRCGQPTGIPIVYGYPGPEMLEASEAGQIELGGCICTFDQPQWACRACHHRWRSPDPVQSQPQTKARP
jgi:hypothetical protein